MEAFYRSLLWWPSMVAFYGGLLWGPSMGTFYGGLYKSDGLDGNWVSMTFH